MLRLILESDPIVLELQCNAPAPDAPGALLALTIIQHSERGPKEAAVTYVQEETGAWFTLEPDTSRTASSPHAWLDVVRAHAPALVDECTAWSRRLGL